MGPGDGDSQTMTRWIGNLQSSLVTIRYGAATNLISSILVSKPNIIWIDYFSYRFWFSRMKVMTGRVFGFKSKLRIFLNN